VIALRAYLPIRRVVGPADVAALAVHIMINTALTGATHDVDGGPAARRWLAKKSGACMSSVTYEKEITALLVIDPYNDFISEGGKLSDRLKAVAEDNHCVPHMLQVDSGFDSSNLRTSLPLSSDGLKSFEDLLAGHPSSQ
jgi:hypothetical protein